MSVRLSSRYELLLQIRLPSSSINVVSVYNLKPYIRMTRSIQGTPARKVMTGNLSSCVHYQLGIALQVLSKQPHCFSKRTNLAVWVLPSGRVGDGPSALR